MNGAWVWRLPSGPALGIEAEPNVIGGPPAMTVAQRGAQEVHDLAHHLGPVRLGELIEERPAEGAEPAFHAGLERRRARHELDLLQAEAARGQELAIFLGGGEKP